MSLLLSVVIGSLTAGFGAAAEPTATAGGATSPDTPVDWFNFDSGQRLVIIVAVIAAFAIVTSADILGRSIATGKAVSAGLIPLTKPQPARRQVVGDDPSGLVYSVRGGEQPTCLTVRH